MEGYRHTAWLSGEIETQLLITAWISISEIPTQVKMIYRRKKSQCRNTEAFPIFLRSSIRSLLTRISFRGFQTTKQVQPMRTKLQTLPILDHLFLKT
jgi:hypothetical protein